MRLHIRLPRVVIVTVVGSGLLVLGGYLNDGFREPIASAAGPYISRAVTLPNVSQHPFQESPTIHDNQNPPYHLNWLGEGRGTVGADDCYPSPWDHGIRARSNELTGVEGFSKKGPFFRNGDPTTGANHDANHLAVFFHVHQCYAGGSEYGFTRHLSHGTNTPGDQPVAFYQCTQCNTDGCTVLPDPTQPCSTSEVVWNSGNSSSPNYVYQVTFTDAGTTKCSDTPNHDFLIQILKADGTQVSSQTICRKWWMPKEIEGAAGWITANSHSDGNNPNDKNYDGGLSDKFGGSYNEVDEIRCFYLPTTVGACGS